MPQNFDPSKPIYRSPLASKEMRDQLQSLDSCHSGSSSPPNPQEGKLWFRTTDYSFWQYMFSDWRMLFKFDPTAGKVILGTDFGGYRTAVEPLGIKDGVNDTFTLPNSESYHPGTLAVLLNGQQYNPANIQMIGPDYKTFTIVGDTLPISDDVISITYLVR
jgi:hypothetical protein